MIPFLPRFKPAFPPTRLALNDPNGLLAAGGSLTPEWLLAAYRRGIYPWYNDPGEIFWWSPAPRMVLIPKHLHVSKSLRKFARKQSMSISFNRAFDSVISLCANSRDDTWILPEMQEAYLRLHQLGHAHSVECWQNGALVGGLYGVHLGQQFFGESMFSRATNASKIALMALALHCEKWGIAAIDCQMHTSHLESMGAELYDRTAFEAMLEGCDLPSKADWCFRPEWMNV